MPEPGFLRAVEVLTDALLTPQEFARHKPSPDQMTLRWVTIHPHGDGEEGRRIQINTETGEIEKGFGAGKTMHEAFAPKSGTLAASETTAAPSRKWYGMTYRPPALGAIPKGEYEHKPHPDFRHGQISYNEPLSQEMQDAYELTPIHEDGDIPAVAKSVGAAMGKYAGEYAKPQNAQLLDNQLSLERIRKLLGHVDKEKLKAEFRKQFGQESDADRIESEASSIADGVQKQKQRSMIYQADDKERLAEKHGKPIDAYHDLPFDDWMKLRAADDESGREPQKPDDAILSKYPSLASGGGGQAATYANFGGNKPESPSLPPEIAAKYPSLAEEPKASDPDPEESPDSRFASAIHDGRVDDAMAVLSKLPHKQAEKIAGDLGMPVYNSKTKKGLLETVRKIAENNTPEKREARSKRESIQSANADAKRALDNADAHALGRMGAPLDQGLSDEQIRDPHSDDHRHAVQAAWSKKVAAAFSKLDKSDTTAQALIAKAKHLGIYDADKKSPEAAIAEKYPSLAEPKPAEQSPSSQDAAKEPWQMRRDDFVDSELDKAANDPSHPEYSAMKSMSSAGKFRQWQDSLRKNLTAKWYDSREKAASEGKPVSEKPAWMLTKAEEERQYGNGESEHRQDITNALAAGKPVPAEVLAEYPDLKPKAAFKPEGVPGEQMGLFDQDAGGQKSLFNVVKPDKKSKKAPAAAPSELEKIRDEHKARSEESAPLPGQKSIRGLATKPKNTAEADEKIASQKMASDFLQESRDEKEQAKRKERVSQWRSGFTGSPKENNASGDIARHDWEKALQNGVSPKRLSEMVDSAVQAGALDAGVGKHLKSRFIEDQYPSLKGFAVDRPESIESPSDLLEKAQEYTEYGENYSRNIATSANRLQSLIDRGHSVQQIRMAADELATRLKVHGDDSQDSKPDSQGNDDPLSIESLKSDISAIEDSIKVHDAKIAAHLRDGRSKGYWDNEDDESAYHKANSERQKAIKDLNDKKTELQKGIESTPEFQKKRQAALDAARRKDNKSERNITSTTYENAMARQSRDFNARYNNRADAMLPARSLDNTFNSDGSVNHESFREDRTTGQSTSPQDESKPSDHAIDPLDIGKHNITEVLENQKADILKSDPKLSPNAAASLAGARVFNALNGRAEEFRRGIDDRVRKGEEISDDEDAKYIAAGDARRNLHSDIVQHTGYRPMGEVDGHPEANKPLVGKANEQEQPTAPQSNPQDELKRHNEEFAAFQEKSIPVFQQEMAMRKELRALFDEPPSKERDKQTRSLQKKLDKVVAAAEEYRKKGDELRERGDSLVAQVRGQQFSRKAPHEELIHHLHEAMNHDGKCCYEKEEGEDDIADHVPADHRHMDKSVHELCRHLGASHPELQAAYENYTAAME